VRGPRKLVIGDGYFLATPQTSVYKTENILSEMVTMVLIDIIPGLYREKNVTAF
jgi:hypothetical protein